MHRRWWSRLLGFLLLGAVIAVGPIWIYRHELGVQGYLPENLYDQIPKWLTPDA
jgi:hypothetical protein